MNEETECRRTTRTQEERDGEVTMMGIAGDGETLIKGQNGDVNVNEYKDA